MNHSILESSYLYQSYMPLTQSTLPQVSTAKRQQIQQQLRRDRINHFISCSYERKLISGSVLLCAGCLHELSASVESAVHEKTLALEAHRQYLDTLRKSAQGKRRNSSETNAPQVGKWSSTDYAGLEEKARKLRSDIAFLANSYEKSERDIAQAKKLYYDQCEEGMHDLTCEERMVQEELEELLYSVRSLEAELAILQPRSLHPLYDRIEIDPDHRYATINALRVGLLPRPEIQMNYKEINLGLCAVAAMCQQTQRLLGSDSQLILSGRLVRLLPLGDRVLIKLERKADDPESCAISLYLEAGLELASLPSNLRSSSLSPPQSPSRAFSEGTRSSTSSVAGEVENGMLCRATIVLSCVLLWLSLRAQVSPQDAQTDAPQTSHRQRLLKLCADVPASESILRLLLALDMNLPIGCEEGSFAVGGEEEGYDFTDDYDAPLPHASLDVERSVLAAQREVASRGRVLAEKGRDVHFVHSLLIGSLAVFARCFL